MQIEIQDLVEIGLYEREDEVIKDGLRHLLLSHPEYKVKVAAEKYRKGKISLGKAAAIAGVSIEEMKELLREFGIPIMGQDRVEEIIEDAEVARKAMR